MAIHFFNAQAGQLTLIIVIFSRLWPRVAGIQASLEQIATTLPSFKAVKSLQYECEEAREFEMNQSMVKPIDLKNEIQCQNVFFRYNKDGTYALKDVNLVIPANKMIAFVGDPELEKYVN